ncbi:MAG: NAD-dependent epimerase/dehydratase family protein [Roseicyclus sp.]
MNDGPVVITGAGGFVCSGLALGCAGAGRDVIAVDRAFDGPPAHDRIRHVRADLPGGLAALGLPRPAAVIHGAALTADPDTLGLSTAAHLKTNLGMHLDCLDWARAAGADRFLFLSSMGVFAPTDGLGRAHLTEADMATGTGAYQTAKQAGEAINAAAAEDGFATLSLRLGNVFGPGERARPSRPWVSLAARMIAQARRGEAVDPGAGAGLREWAWLPDLARGVADLLEEIPTLGGVLHAGNPPALADRDLAGRIVARSPGSRLGAERDLPGLRPPMASNVASALSGVAWTPIDEALDRLIAGEVAA